MKERRKKGRRLERIRNERKLSEDNKKLTVQ